MDVKIKICGITAEREAGWLNEAGVDYAGFVLYEKSKRNISANDVRNIFKKLNPDIKKVAVTVSPDMDMLKKVEQAGFDIMQIHGDVPASLIEASRIPVWIARNIADITEVRRWRRTYEATVAYDAVCHDGEPLHVDYVVLHDEGSRTAASIVMDNVAWTGEDSPLNSADALVPDILHGRFPQVEALLLDAGDFGSGRTFGWDGENSSSEAAGRGVSGSGGILAESAANTPLEAENGSGTGGSARWDDLAWLRQTLSERGIKLVLAGGLNSENVADGVRLVHPDIVDVSSGVENVGKSTTNGKEGVPSGAERVEKPDVKIAVDAFQYTKETEMSSRQIAMSLYKAKTPTGKNREKIEAFVRAVREA